MTRNTRPLIGAPGPDFGVNSLLPRLLGEFNSPQDHVTNEQDSFDEELYLLGKLQEIKGESGEITEKLRQSMIQRLKIINSSL